MHRTSEIGLAAALAAMGVPVNAVEFEGRRAIFVFDDDEMCSMLEHLYFDNKLYLNAQSFHDNYRRLMARAKQGSY